MTQVVRSGNWTTLSSGKKFYPMDPRADEVEPTDIAHALSMLCRWGGHCKSFMSVAQHCVLVSRLGRTLEERKWGLLHDAAEAYVGDMITPVKRHLKEYQNVEDKILAAIAERFGMSLPWPKRVGEADKIMMATEARDLMSPGCLAKKGYPPPTTIKIEPWSQLKARNSWLCEYHQLFAQLDDGPKKLYTVTAHYPVANILLDVEVKEGDQAAAFVMAKHMVSSKFGEETMLAASEWSIN